MLGVIVPVHKPNLQMLEKTLRSILASECQPGEPVYRHLLWVASNGDDPPAKVIDLVCKLKDEQFQIEKDNYRGHQPSEKVQTYYWEIIHTISPFANKAVAINQALMGIQGKEGTETAPYYVTVCDADDLWTRTKVWSQLRFLDANPEVEVLGTRFQYIDADDNPLPGTPVLPLGCHEIWSALDRGENPMANSSVVWSRNLHSRFGLFDPLNKCEDYEWWKRLREFNIEMANLPEVQMLHRLHSGSHFNGSRQQEVYKSFTDNCYKVHQTMKNVP